MKKKRRAVHDMRRDEILAHVWELQEDFWGWTLAELASQADLSPSTVHRLWHEETKDCRSSTLLKLIEAVGLEMYLQCPEKEEKKLKIAS